MIGFSNNVKDHIQHVDEILHCLKEAGVTLNIKKCKCFTTAVEYLGNIIKHGTLEVDHAHTASLKEALPPTNKSELRSFLGLCNVYRRFVHKYSTVAGPLNALPQKNQPDNFTLDEIQLEAFKDLIGTMLSPPALALSKNGLPYSIDTHASDYVIGFSLFQTDNGDRGTIGYWSRSLTPSTLLWNNLDIFQKTRFFHQ